MFAEDLAFNGWRPCHCSASSSPIRMPVRSATRIIVGHSPSTTQLCCDPGVTDLFAMLRP